MAAPAPPRLLTWNPAQQRHLRGTATRAVRNLSQKGKFLAAAQAFEADETGKSVLRSFKTIAKHKPKE